MQVSNTSVNVLTPKTNVRHYIFGYGSLINSISRNVTGETGVAVPVKVSGFVRHWSNISSGFGMSSVVVVPEQQGACNGVLVEVDAAEFSSFDKREQGYKRVLIDSSQIEFYNQDDSLFTADSATSKNSEDSPQEINVWLYQTVKIVSPCPNNPVVLSYLDVILSGCLEYSQQFCHDFINLTQGWQHAMLNDRQEPRYPRVQPELNTQILNPYIAIKSPLATSEISVGYNLDQ